jgi:hypothetical protein
MEQDPFRGKRLHDPEPAERAEPLDLEPTDDPALIREILTHPKIWPWITDDSSPDPEAFKPVISEAFTYLLVRDVEGPLGIFLFTPQTGVTWEVHTCLLPRSSGDLARQAALEAQAWIWDRTPCRRIVTSVPIYNRLAVRFALAAGLTQYGRDPASIERGGRLWDRLLLGISRPPDTVYEFPLTLCQPPSPSPPPSEPPDPSAAP